MSTAQPGWYPDNTGRQRWWDGQAWQQYAPAPQPAVMVAPQPLPSNGMATASMVLGIVGFALSLTIIGLFVAVPMAIVGLALGIAGLNAVKRIGRGKGQAIAGIVLCGLPFVLTVINVVSGVFAKGLGY